MVLSISNVSPIQGSRYYTAEGYYSNEEQQHRSVWTGKLATELGLAGQIKPEDFNQLLEGCNLEGEPLVDKSRLYAQQRAMEINGSDRRQIPTALAAYDLTTSAPKSVSIQAIVFRDERLEMTHRLATARMLDITESRYATTRVTHQRKRQVINTGNFLVAQFHHDTSRALDPQLHTHNVVLNVVKLDNGKWQSIDNRALYANKMLLGRIYRNELARAVQALGYEIRVTNQRHGLWELQGYIPQQLDLFSKRAQQIQKTASPEASSQEKAWVAAHSNRAKKQAIAREDLLPRWLAEVQTAGINPVTLQPFTMLSPKDISEIVQASIAHCSEREVAFRREEIELFALSKIGQVSIAELQKAIDSAQDLIPFTSQKGQRYTTQTALNREQHTIALLRNGQGMVPAIAPLAFVNHALQGQPLSQEQRQAIELAATSSDRVLAWQGVAGAGKTYAMQAFSQIAQAAGYEVKGYAPSAEAAKTLEAETGIPSQTIARLLYSQPRDDDRSKPQVWICDEAGLLSAKDAEWLLAQAQADRARLILVGDTRQLSAVEAGNPFKSLQQHGMATAYLTESRRQKALDLKVAVDLAAAGRLEESFAHLESSGKVKQITNREERIARLVQDYLSLTAQQRDNTLILAGTNWEREAIAQAIRTGLRQEGGLIGSRSVQTLKSKDLTQAQMNFVHHYSLSDRVMPLANCKRLGLEKGKLYNIVQIEQETLTIQSAEGTLHRVNPRRIQRQAVYETQKLDIAVGDRLKWTKNDTATGRRNGQEFTVRAIDGTTAQIQYRSGTTDSLDLTQPLHLDYALVSTIYSSQGKTADRVLISASADRTLSRESFYVALSRAKYDLHLYVEDKTRFLSRMQASSAKENPLELLQGTRTHAADPTLQTTLQRTATSPVNGQPTTPDDSRAAPQCNPYPAQTESSRPADASQGNSTHRSDSFTPNRSHGTASGTDIRASLAFTTDEQRMAGLDATRASDRRAGGSASRHLEAPASESDYPQTNAGSSSQEGRSHRDCLHQLANEFAELERVFSGESTERYEPTNDFTAPDRDQPEAAANDRRANEKPDPRSNQYPHTRPAQFELERDWEPGR